MVREGVAADAAQTFDEAWLVSTSTGHPLPGPRPGLPRASWNWHRGSIYTKESINPDILGCFFSERLFRPTSLSNLEDPWAAAGPHSLRPPSLHSTGPRQVQA